MFPLGRLLELYKAQYNPTAYVTESDNLVSDY